ncbi:sensor histidine kinase [Limnoglobus roseus]|uniref:histidine kinase n=1 Tax=Limnoglobus roseus TaxID=2598579 RepID=A0A5C1AMH9_9BACT|nr:ATP-binding protein [Limnoglobus roseus]QEL19176.1 sensor histidine kinase [Limnoglobus roseus]
MSIRARLLTCLVPGFAVVCVVVGIVVFVTTKRGLEADLDARLAEITGMARTAMRTPAVDGRPAPGIRGMTLDRFVSRDEFSTTGEYFQLWGPDGGTERKSPNLGAAGLPYPTEFSREGAVSECTLPNGDTVRIRAVRLIQTGGRGTVDFAVAASRKDVDLRMSRLVVELVVGGVACCAALSGLLALALKVALRPLAKLGERAAAMDAESLDQRFPTESMPAEVRPIVARLNDLLARLEQGFERERRFSGDLAHELRTPLAAIRTTSEVAAKWPEQAGTEDFREIADLAARLQQTVDTLLTLARTEASAAGVSREPVELAPLVRECAALSGRMAAERNITVVESLQSGVELESDPRLLRIIVTNLVSNAVEYAPPGSRVTLACGEGARMLAVTNPAPGLSTADLTHLFDRLWRKDTSRSDHTHSGLGLAVAQSCAVALGLELVAELDPDGTLSMSLLRAK